MPPAYILLSLLSNSSLSLSLSTVSFFLLFIANSFFLPVPSFNLHWYSCYIHPPVPWLRSLCFLFLSLSLSSLSHFLYFIDPFISFLSLQNAFRFEKKWRPRQNPYTAKIIFHSFLSEKLVGSSYNDIIILNFNA